MCDLVKMELQCTELRVQLPIKNALTGKVGNGTSGVYCVTESSDELGLSWRSGECKEADAFRSTDQKRRLPQGLISSNRARTVVQSCSRGYAAQDQRTRKRVRCYVPSLRDFNYNMPAKLNNTSRHELTIGSIGPKLGYPTGSRSVRAHADC